MEAYQTSAHAEPIGNGTNTGTEPEFKTPVQSSSKYEGSWIISGKGRSALRSKSLSTARALDDQINRRKKIANHWAKLYRPEWGLTLAVYVVFENKNY